MSLGTAWNKYRSSWSGSWSMLRSRSWSWFRSQSGSGSGSVYRSRSGYNESYGRMS